MIPLIYNDEFIIYENYIRSTNFIEINLKNYLEFSKTFLFESNKLHKWKNLFDSYFEKQALLFLNFIPLIEKTIVHEFTFELLL